MRRGSKQGFLGNDLGAINSSPVGAVAVVCGKRQERISEAQKGMVPQAYEGLSGTRGWKKANTSSQGEKGECERWSGRAQTVNATYLPFGYQNIFCDGQKG